MKAREVIMSEKGEEQNISSSVDVPGDEGTNAHGHVSFPETEHDVPLEQLNLSLRTLNCLKRARIATVAELINKEEKELLVLLHLGPKTKQEIDEHLKAWGNCTEP